MMMVFVMFFLQAIPLWIFAGPWIVFTAIYIRFWERAVLRNVCISISVLIPVLAIPVCVVQACCRAGGGAALERRFGRLVETDHVAKYRFVVAGIGDTREFWKLKDVDANSCQKVIDEYKLKPVSPDPTSRPDSGTAAPWWWPSSTEGYTISQADDGEMGRIEIWVATTASTVYLYRFIE